jgi:hypothetical protein
MSIREPETTVVDIAEVRRDVDGTIKRLVRDGIRLVVAEDGAPLAIIVSPSDMARIERRERERAERFKVIDEVRSAFADIAEEELEREAAKAVAEVREEMRKELERSNGPLYLRRKESQW